MDESHDSTSQSGMRERRVRPNSRDRPANRTSLVVGASRFIILLAIIGTFLSALSMLVFGLIVVLKSIWNAFRSAEFDVEHAKHLAVDLIEMTDFFLLGMVLYVVGFGMFQLFIDVDIPMPAWMRVSSLADLKTQLINVIVVLLAVSFLATAVSWTSDRSILYFGISIAAVVVSMAGYNLIHYRMEHNGDPQ